MSGQSKIDTSPVLPGTLIHGERFIRCRTSRQVELEIRFEDVRRSLLIIALCWLPVKKFSLDFRVPNWHW
jgi:hypothetical protein